MSLDAAIRAFGPILQSKTRQILAEFGSAYETRGKGWLDIHEKLSNRIGEEFADIPVIAREMMLRRHCDNGEIMHRFERDISTARSSIGAHQIGWTSNRPKTLPERRPVLFAILMALFGILFWEFWQIHWIKS